jgi:glycerol kinase
VLATTGCSWRDVDALGLANQGETTIAWDAATGRPAGPALSWQDRRTAAYCAELVHAGQQDEVRSRTGSPIDPYFAASKIRWLLDASEEAQDAVARGTLRVGVPTRLCASGVVPSFGGLAAPRWQPAARAAVLGMTLDTSPVIS